MNMTKNRIHHILLMPLLFYIQQRVLDLIQPFQALGKERGMKAGKVKTHGVCESKLFPLTVFYRRRLVRKRCRATLPG